MIRFIRQLWFFLACCAIILLFLFFRGPAFAEDIHVGVILPLTGKLSEYGLVEQRSFLMAANEINAAGGVRDNKKIRVVIKDTLGKPDVGRSAVEKLITQHHVIVVGGGYSSSVALAAAQVAQDYRVPFLINTASADKITELGWAYIFRLNPPASEHFWALASFLKEATNVKTFAIISENRLDPYRSRKFLNLSTTLGLKPVLKESYISGAADFRPLLLRVKTKRPDLIYLVTHVMDASAVMLQAREVDLRPKLFLGHRAGVISPQFRMTAAEAGEYVFSSTLWAPSVPYPGARDYADRFFARYGAYPEYHGAEAYAAMYVIADALERADSLSPEHVREALVKTDMKTAFGPVQFLSYEKKTQQNKLPTILVQWINGRLETVWPKDIASHDYIYPMPSHSERGPYTSYHAKAF